MNNIDFYDNIDLRYPEIAIAMQDINKHNPGKVKFAIPILTPTIDTSKKIENYVHLNKRNLKNNTPIEIKDIIINNYIEIAMSSSICITQPEDEYIPSGSKWVVVFVGGDITKPQIISRYLE